MDNEKTISEEEISLLAKRVGQKKYLDRQQNFFLWIKRFIADAAKKKSYPKNARFLNGMNEYEMSVYLNYFYWYRVEDFVKKHLKEYSSTGKVRINHYKIAATTEYIIMRYLPFEDKNGEPLINLNANFAFHVSLQILFSWNRVKDKLDYNTIKELLKHDKSTKEFIREHRAWLKNHCVSNPYTILSNMQTLRLFHYWFREPKENFKSH